MPWNELVETSIKTQTEEENGLGNIVQNWNNETIAILNTDPLSHKSYTEQMKELIPNNIQKGATHPIFLSNHFENLLEEPTEVERMLLRKWLLYAGKDGKLYFTPDAIQYYVSKAVIKAGVPEDLLRPWINPFGFHCIDGRVTLPEGFRDMALPDQLKSYTGTIPGGWAGMLLNILASLIEVYGEDNHEIIKNVVLAVLKQNKENNPDNYKIQWHTDKKTEDEKKHTHTDEFSCGCGFIMRAIADPERFGVNPRATELAVEILNDRNRSHNPDILGENDKHLERHKERAAIIARWIENEESVYQNYIMAKQVDFSPFLSPAELQKLSPEEKMELNQMAFTGNFRAFGVKGSQIATILEDIILNEDHFLDHVHLSDKQKVWLASKTLYFAPQLNKKMAGAALRSILTSKLKKNIEFMTDVTKMKLSPSSPLVTIDIDKDTNEPIIVSVDVVV